MSWRTAQTTGALFYLSYAEAQQYDAGCSVQDEIAAAEHQAARDAILSLSPFAGGNEKDPDPTGGQAAAVKEHIGVLQGDLLPDSLVKSLDGEYENFFSTHP